MGVCGAERQYIKAIGTSTPTKSRTVTKVMKCGFPGGLRIQTCTQCFWNGCTTQLSCELTRLREKRRSRLPQEQLGGLVGGSGVYLLGRCLSCCPVYSHYMIGDALEDDER